METQLTTEQETIKFLNIIENALYALENFELTPKQKQKWKSLIDDCRNSIVSIVKDLTPEMKELRQTMNVGLAQHKTEIPSHLANTLSPKETFTETHNEKETHYIHTYLLHS